MSVFKIRGHNNLWLIMVGFGVGVLAAFPIAAPILGSVIPESAATLWGSALGAMIAVAGAFWATERAQSGERRNANALVLEMVKPMAFFLDELRGAYGYPSDRADHSENDQEPNILTVDDWTEVRNAAGILAAEDISLNKKLHRIDATLNFLGPEEIATYFNLESDLESLMETVHGLLARASEAGLRIYPAHASWSKRFALAVHAKHINGHIAVLAKAAR